jgi:hypothetical protein
MFQALQGANCIPRDLVGQQEAPMSDRRVHVTTLLDVRPRPLNVQLCQHFQGTSSPIICLLSATLTWRDRERV